MSWQLTTPAIMLTLFCIASSCVATDKATWVEIGDTVYGAKPDKQGPIGGGKGYERIITKGD